MRSRYAVLVLVLFVCSLCGQLQKSPSGGHVPVIYLDYAANDLSHDAIDLALSTSSFRMTETREDADLVLRFDRQVSKLDRKTDGNQINIGVSWELHLDVSDRNGKGIWKSSMPLAMPLRTGHTEDAWIAFLRQTSEYQITKQFLKENHN